MNSIIRARSLSQKTVAISFLADVFYNFPACLTNVRASTTFTAGWSLALTLNNETQFKMWLINFIPPLCYRSKKAKGRSEAVACILCSHASNFGTHLAQNFWEPSLNVIVLYRRVHNIYGNIDEGSETVKLCFIVFRSTLWTKSSPTTHGRQTTLLFIMNMSYSSFTRHISAVKYCL
jgi:hypothetical protein